MLKKLHILGNHWILNVCSYFLAQFSLNKLLMLSEILMIVAFQGKRSQQSNLNQEHKSGHISESLAYFGYHLFLSSPRGAWPFDELRRYHTSPYNSIGAPKMYILENAF